MYATHSRTGGFVRQGAEISSTTGSEYVPRVSAAQPHSTRYQTITAVDDVAAPVARVVAPADTDVYGPPTLVAYRRSPSC